MTCIAIRGIVVAAVLAAGPVWSAGPDRLAKPVSIGGKASGARVAGKVDLERPMMRELHQELIQKAIQKQLETEWSGRVKSVQVAVIEPAGPLPIPSGVVELHLPMLASESGLGRRTFMLQVVVDGRLWKTVETVTDVAATVEAVVLTRSLRAEEVVEAEDLSVTRVPVNDLRHGYLTSPDAVIGKSAARPLQENTPLRTSFLKAPMMVKKGDRVMIEARRGGLSIQTSGVTKGSGQVGQSVMVANLESGREFRAKIVSPGVVQVDF